MSKLKLVFPTLAYKQKALDYIQEHYNDNEENLQGVGGLTNFPYEEWVERVKQLHNKTNIPNGLVSASTYFGVVDNEIAGMIDIRHELNDYLFCFGGHIGYGIRPSQRKQGYAKEMLKQALVKASELGIGKVLLTCHKENIGSTRTILSQGGILENEVESADGIIQRYWITIKK